LRSTEREQITKTENKNMKTLINRFRHAAVRAVCLLILALICLTPSLAPAQPVTSAISPRVETLAYQLPLTNGATLTINSQTNVLANAACTHAINLLAMIGPSAAHSPTNGNFCTNLVLTFQYVYGTNVPTDSSGTFVWTITPGTLPATNLLPAFTNTVTTVSNLPASVVDGVTAIRLVSALGNSTNALPNLLTIQVIQVP
jgi:hypothetical protein